MNDMSMRPASGDWLGWIIVIVGALVTTWAIGASIYWIVRPSEREPEHPKNLILRDDR
jgi:hypothetical protein